MLNTLVNIAIKTFNGKESGDGGVQVTHRMEEGISASSRALL